MLRDSPDDLEGRRSCRVPQPVFRSKTTHWPCLSSLPVIAVLCTRWPLVTMYRYPKRQDAGAESARAGK